MMKTLILIGLACVLPIMAGNRALIVTVDEQFHHPKAKLDGLDNDRRNMREVCRALGFQDSEIKIIHGREATKGNIVGALQNWLIAGTSSNDRALFYYSGHGMSLADRSGDEVDRKDETLCPADIQVVNRRLRNALTDDELGKLLGRIPSRNTLVILDSCHSGTATKDSLLFEDSDLQAREMSLGTDLLPIQRDKATFGVRATQPGYVAISSCRDDEVAYGHKFRGGYFTQGIHKAVTSAHRNGQPLTYHQLVQLASDFIATNLRPSRLVHHPQISGNREAFSKNIFTRRPAPVSQHGPEWKKFARIANRANYTLNARANGKTYNIGDHLEISVGIPQKGYLNIVSVGTDGSVVVLFPNQFRRDNAVNKFQELVIPRDFNRDGFKFAAQGPPGDTLIVVLHSEKRINLYEDLGTASTAFKSLDRQELDGFTKNWAVVSGNSRHGYGASKLKLTIR